MKTNRLISTLFVVGLVLLVGAVPAAAQSDALTSVVDLSPGYTITVPDGWDVADLDPGTELKGDNITMVVLTPPEVEALMGDAFTPNLKTCCAACISCCLNSAHVFRRLTIHVSATWTGSSGTTSTKTARLKATLPSSL